MKVSLITVTYNAAEFIQDCIESVIMQDYSDIEYIIIDGGSNDGTVEIIQKYEAHLAYWVSEPDKGIYDAMNKGLRQAHGDIIGLLNADDMYTHTEVVSRIIQEFKEKRVDSVFGDLVITKREDTSRIIRFYPGKNFKPKQFASGNMPPHPTFYVKKSLYEQYGDFDTSYKICADFDLMVRFLYKKEASYSYIPEVLITMRSGGNSSRSLGVLRTTFALNREMLEACRKYEIKTNLLFIYTKYFQKIFQLIRRPSLQY